MVISLNTFGSGPPKTVSEIVDLRIYPIKSCRGISISSSTLTRQGLDLDRRWMFADAEKYEFITIRQNSKMTLIDTAIANADDGQECLQISIRGTEQKVSVPARPTKLWLESNTTLRTVNIWGSDTDGWVYSDDVNGIFTEFFGKPVALVYKGPTARLAGGNAHKSLLGREESVNFPDVMPLQIANEASIRELNKRLREKGVEEITIERFRPNVIVKGASMLSTDDLLPKAWTEDSWKTVRIINREASGLSSYLTSNALTIDVAARCARCQVPNVNPDTAYKNPKEPWDTLVSYRRVDEGIKFKPCFGMLSCPRNEGPIAVGMRFEVTQTTDSHYYAKGF